MAYNATKATTTTKAATVTTKPELIVGSIDELQSRLNELNKELTGTVVSDERLKEITAEKNTIEEQIKQLKIRNGLLQPDKAVVESPTAKEGSLSWVQEQLSQKNAALNLEIVGSTEWNQLVKEIAELTEKEHTIEIDVETKRIKAPFEIAEQKARKYQERMDGISNSIGNIGTAFSEVGNTFDTPVFDVAGTMAQAVATMIAGYATATSQAAALGPFGWIGFAATGLATLMGLIASVKGAAGFADGGIISGNSYYGDNILARVNAGEMVLNRTQQANLFRALDGGFVNGGAAIAEVRIKGSDLYLALNNYKKKSRIE